MGIINSGLKLYKEYGINFIYAGIMYKFLRKGNIEYKLNWKGMSVFGNHRTAAFATFKEVLGVQVYDYPVKNPKVIVDLGANIGVSVIYFREKYPRAEIIAVEPAEENIKFLLKNINYNRIDNISINKNPIWDSVKGLTFSAGDCSPSDAFNTKGKGKKFKAITMPILMKEYNIEHIDILKCDIEGAEDPILIRNNEWLNKVDNIFIELHSMVHANIGSLELAPKVFEALKEKGFIFKQMREGLFWFRR
jgi:FkbM family methyltransferase